MAQLSFNNACTLLSQFESPMKHGACCFMSTLFHSRARQRVAVPSIHFSNAGETSCVRFRGIRFASRACKSVSSGTRGPSRSRGLCLRWWATFEELRSRSCAQRARPTCGTSRKIERFRSFQRQFDCAHSQSHRPLDRSHQSRCTTDHSSSTTRA